MENRTSHADPKLYTLDKLRYAMPEASKNFNFEEKLEEFVRNAYHTATNFLTAGQTISSHPMSR